MNLSEALPTTAIDIVCRSLHAETLLTTVRKGLAQGPYLAVRAGFEPTTLQSKGVVSINASPSPTFLMETSTSFPTLYVGYGSFTYLTYA